MAPAKRPAALRVKQMSNEKLVENAEKIGTEINRRVAELGDGLKHLGVEGLRLHAAGKKQAVVRFPGYHKEYVYNVPTEAEPGDTVRTPAPGGGAGVQSLGSIVRIGGNGYTGPVKDVLALFKPTHGKA